MSSVQIVTDNNRFTNIVPPRVNLDAITLPAPKTSIVSTSLVTDFDLGFLTVASISSDTGFLKCYYINTCADRQDLEVKKEIPAAKVFIEKRKHRIEIIVFTIDHVSLSTIM
jgi:hypothetical protein